MDLLPPPVALTGVIVTASSAAFVHLLLSSQRTVRHRAQKHDRDCRSVCHRGWRGAVSAAGFWWQDTGQEATSSSSSPVSSRLFQQCTGELCRVRYKWDGRWYVAKLKSFDCDGTYTAILQDGFVQFGTPEADIWRHVARRQHRRRNLGQGLQPTEADAAAKTEGGTGQGEEEELTLWNAARAGDAERIQELLQCDGKGLADLNVPERLPGGQSGRTALYWACLCGHTECTRLLLEAGATDTDGSSWDAVTAAVGNEAHESELTSAYSDLCFDPDEGIYTEGPAAKTTGSATAAPNSATGSGSAANQVADMRALLQSHGLGGGGGSSSTGGRQLATTAALLRMHSRGSERGIPTPTHAFVVGREQEITDTTTSCSSSSSSSCTGGCQPLADCHTAAGDGMLGQSGDGSVSGAAAGGAAALLCSICWEREIEALISPCGHAVGCWECLTRVRGERAAGCPLCRKPIRELSRISLS